MQTRFEALVRAGSPHYELLHVATLTQEVRILILCHNPVLKFAGPSYARGGYNALQECFAR